MPRYVYNSISIVLTTSQASGAQNFEQVVEMFQSAAPPVCMLSIFGQDTEHSVASDV